MWPFKKHQPQQSEKRVKAVTASDDDMAWARSLVQGSFEPSLRRQLEVFNQTLAKRGLRAGIEVQWFFDKVVEEKEQGEKRQ